jgi:TonB family protein
VQRRRSDLCIGLFAAIVLHGLALAAAAKVLLPRADESGLSTDPPLEVVLLDEIFFELQLENTAPALTEPLEARAHHAPTELPAWPELDAAREMETPRTLEIAPRRSPIEPDPTRRPKPRERLQSLPLLERTAPPVELVETSAPTGPPTPVMIAGSSSLVLHRPQLHYPSRPHRRGIEGLVRVGLELGPDGRVTRTWVIKSSGNRELDRAALKNLKGWRFDARAIAAAAYGNRSFRNDVRFEID